MAALIKIIEKLKKLQKNGAGDVSLTAFFVGDFLAFDYFLSVGCGTGILKYLCSGRV